jgi:hypothetical protein
VGAALLQTGLDGKQRARRFSPAGFLIGARALEQIVRKMSPPWRPEMQQVRTRSRCRMILRRRLRGK